MYVEAFLVNVKNGKQPKCPSWRNKFWNIQILEYNASENEIKFHVFTWKFLKI